MADPVALSEERLVERVSAKLAPLLKPKDPPLVRPLEEPRHGDIGISMGRSIVLCGKQGDGRPQVHAGRVGQGGKVKVKAKQHEVGGQDRG